MGVSRVAGMVVVAAFVVPGHADGRAAVTIAPGIYRGTVSDPDGEPETYAVRIRVTTKRLVARHRAATVLYQVAADPETNAPALHCKGTLSFQRRRGSRLTFHERIAGGAARECVNGGTIVLTRKSSRTFTYTWSKPGVVRPTPTATLTR